MIPKNFWQSKAFWLGILTIIGGCIEFYFSLPVGAAVSTIVVGIIQIIIRFYTNAPVTGTPGAKAPKLFIKGS